MQPEFITGATVCMGPFLAVAFVTGLQRCFPRTNQYGPLQSRYRASSLAKPGRAVAINNLATRWGLSCKKRAGKELAQGDEPTPSFSSGPAPRPTDLRHSPPFLRRSAPPPPPPPSSHSLTGPPRRAADPSPEFLRPPRRSPRMLGAARRQLGSGPVSTKHILTLPSFRSRPGGLVGVGP
jgi:hypothetical protein